MNGQFLMGVMCGVGVCWVLGAGFVLGVLGWLAGQAETPPPTPATGMLRDPHQQADGEGSSSGGSDADRL